MTARPTCVQLEDGWEQKLKTYNKSVLQDNWAEDRVQAAEEVKFEDRQKVLRGTDPDLAQVAAVTDAKNLLVPHVIRHVLPDTRRTIPVQNPVSKETPFVAGDHDYTTTNQAVWAAQSQYTTKVKKATMITPGQFKSTMSKDRTTRGATQKGFGSTVPSHAPDHNAGHWETTNTKHFQVDPDEARQRYAADPLPEKGDDARYVGGHAASLNPNKPHAGPGYSNSKQFNHTTKLHEFYDSTPGEIQPSGRAGARHQLTQDPAEAGSLYGKSVYLDVYQDQSKPHPTTMRQ